MGEDLLRVESAVSATASGNLTWEKWPYDVSTALGLAGRRNPLGFAAVRFLDSPSRTTAQEVVLLLATWMVKRNVDGRAANDIAWRALEFWNDRRCTKCEGRGKVGIVGRHEQKCPACKGAGHRGYDDKPDPVRDAISCLVEAVEQLDRQIGGRLRGGSCELPQDGYRLALPIVTGNPGGMGGNPRTPKASGHE